MSIEPFQRNAAWLAETRAQLDKPVIREPILSNFKESGMAAFRRAFEDQLSDLGMEPAMAVCSLKQDQSLPKLSLLAQSGTANEIEMSAGLPAKPPAPREKS